MNVESIEKPTSRDMVDAATSPPEPFKRPRGRPRKGTEVPFVSELPAPPSNNIRDPHDFFTYVRSLPKEKRNRVLLSFYRLFPVCDLKETIPETGKRVGQTCVLEIACESEPFPFDNEDWELQVLHLLGCGEYKCFLNEMGKEITKCLNIKTQWDPDSYPPVLDPATVIRDGTLGIRNRAYINWLGSRGIKLPTQEKAELEEAQMQIAETVSKLADTVIQQGQRLATPMPPPPQDKTTPIVMEGLMEMTKKTMDANIESIKAQNSGSDPMRVIEAFSGVMKEMRGDGSNNKTLEMILEQSMRRADAAEERSMKLLERVMTMQQNPPKSELHEFLENMKLAREAFAPAERDEEEKPSKESIGQTLVRSLPTVVPALLGIVDRGFAMFQMARMPTQAMRPPQQPGPVNPYAPQVQPQAAVPQVPPVNHEGPPVAPVAPQSESQQPEDAALAQYRQFIPYIAQLAPAILQHLNDPGHKDEDTGEFIRANGYDFAEWVISPATEGGGGYGRVAYDTIKALGPDVLIGAMKAYQPLWTQISAIEPKVKEFIGEFLTFDEAAGQDDGQGKEPVQ